MQVMINERDSLPDTRLAFDRLRIGRSLRTDFSPSSHYLYKLFRVFNCSLIGSLSGYMLGVLVCAWHGPAIRKVPRAVSVHATSLALPSCPRR